jgi:hypothetical protein
MLSKDYRLGLSFEGVVHLRIFAPVASGILIFISCFGQTSTGRIAGNVTDQTGAAIKGAVVSIVDKRTNRERTTNSSEDGNYAFTGLDPSNYTLRASQSGFSKYRDSEFASAGLRRFDGI